MDFLWKTENLKIGNGFISFGKNTWQNNEIHAVIETLLKLLPVASDHNILLESHQLCALKRSRIN